MKQPLYALLIAPGQEMRNNILSGKNSITIREGHRDYRLGPVMICCHIEPWAVMADITNVRHCVLSEITEKEYRDNGFQTLEDLLKELQRFYPNMTLNSPVTVIQWHNTRGFLVDNKS